MKDVYSVEGKLPSYVFDHRVGGSFYVLSVFYIQGTLLISFHVIT